jgi:pimeloyl-ACP methyl ester carboxylesterase
MAGPRLVSVVTEPHAVRRLLAALGWRPSRGRGRCPPPDPRAIAPTTGRGRPGLCADPEGRVSGPARADLRPPLPLPTVPRHGSCGGRGAGRSDGGRSYRFIALTLRYFAPGPWPDAGAGFSMATHADDLAAFIRQLGGGPVHVVGWSYGGAIGIVLAVHHPEWVKSLFVHEPGLATFVTDPADAQVAGEDRKDTRAPAGVAIKAGDTGAALRLLLDGLTRQPGTIDRLAPALRASLLDTARTLTLSSGRRRRRSPAPSWARSRCQ